MLALLYGRLDTLCDRSSCGLLLVVPVQAVLIPRISVSIHFFPSLSSLILTVCVSIFQFGCSASTSNGLRRGFSSMILSPVHLGSCTHPSAEKFGEGVHRAFPDNFSGALSGPHEYEGAVGDFTEVSGHRMGCDGYVSGIAVNPDNS